MASRPGRCARSRRTGTPPISEPRAGAAPSLGGRGWLLDTNLVSELRKGSRCNPQVAAWAGTIAPAACYLSRITIAEIVLGIETVAEPGFRAELEGWLRDGVRAWFGPRILEVDEPVILAWRRLVLAGQRSHFTYSQPDGLIAATALVHGLAVATRNGQDFARAGVPVIDPWH